MKDYCRVFELHVDPAELEKKYSKILGRLLEESQLDWKKYNAALND